jgi:hypothetical protein
MLSDLPYRRTAKFGSGGARKSLPLSGRHAAAGCRNELFGTERNRAGAPSHGYFG